MLRLEQCRPHSSIGGHTPRSRHGGDGGYELPLPNMSINRYLRSGIQALKTEGG